MKIFLYLFIGLFIHLNVFAQTPLFKYSFNIEYLEVQKIDTSHLTGMSEEQIDFLKQLARGKSALLKTNGSMSEYILASKKNNEISKINTNVGIYDFKMPTMLYYKNLVKDSLYLLTNNTGENLIVTKSSASYKWKLLDDTLTVDGLLTRKAISVDGDTAYYTEAYPIFDGPRGYWGLPGLIVKLENKKSIYQLKKVEQLQEDLVISFPSTLEIISWEEFETRIKNRNSAHMTNGNNEGKTVSAIGNTTITTTTIIEIKKIEL